MEQVAGLIISALAMCCGLCGIIRPELYRSSMEGQYTSSGARIAGIVLLLLGIAGLAAIVGYKGGPVDFFPV